MSGLNNIQIGDKIALKRRPNWSRMDQEAPLTNLIQTVERLTATQAVTKKGMRFRLADGHIIGSSFDRAFIPTQEEIQEHHLQAAYRKRWGDAFGWFNQLNVKTLTLEQVEAMKAALEALEQAK